MSILSVRVIKKLRGEKKELLGYIIEDASGATKQVTKDALKNAVKAGQVDVINMTMTSDGRLIGRAAKNAKAKVRNNTNIRLIEVYTNGRNIVGAMIDESASTNTELAGLKVGTNFDNGKDTMEKIKHGWYSNVTIDNGKPCGDFKKKSFKNIRNKLLTVLAKNNVTGAELTVEKIDKQGRYVVTNQDYSKYTGVINNIICMLLCDTLVTGRIKVESVEDSNVYVSFTNMTEVKKILKTVFKPVPKQ
jgi:hypothetical protein